MLSQELFTIEYTEDAWADESYALGAERADPIPCPRCKRTGFYGPRALDAKYRACRFCGFFQEVGHGPLRFVPVVHGCKSWPECAKAPYVWWVPPEEKKYNCPFCGKSASVHSRKPFTKGTMIVAPSDDPGHPWWRVPQHKSYDYYYKLWEHWPYTKGRVVI